MRRIAAHYLYLSPYLQLKEAVVEINDRGTTERYFLLNEDKVESYNTEFYTGLLAPAFVSPVTPKNEIPDNFIYVNNFEIQNLPTLERYQEFIFDFGNKDLQEISRTLWKLQQLIPHANIFDFINWCSYFPEKLTAKEAGIEKGKVANIWLFENLNLLDKKFTPKTTINVLINNVLMC